MSKKVELNFGKERLRLILASEKLLTEGWNSQEDEEAFAYLQLT